MVGRRWTGAILRVLMDGPLRFSEVAQAVPELSDRLLSERMKELESRGIVERTVNPGPPLRVEYELSQMGRELEPALVRARGAGPPLARRARPTHAPPSAGRARTERSRCRPAGRRSNVRAAPQLTTRSRNAPLTRRE